MIMTVPYLPVELTLFPRDILPGDGLIDTDGDILCEVLRVVTDAETGAFVVTPVPCANPGGMQDYPLYAGESVAVQRYPA
jgi:hypothetical protein